MDFFAKLLCQLVAEGRLDPAAPTLVVAGGTHDWQALLAAGFTNVTISNIEHLNGDEFPPYTWARLDAEALALADDSFDQVIEHMGLHHCASPHAALLEMYRVAARTVLAIENRDSLAMRVAERLGIAASYEIEAVRQNQLETGGVRDTPVPNYVYRWTEREVAKTLASADPVHAAAIRYFYNMRFPEPRVKRARGMRRVVLELSRLPFAVLTGIFPRQANVFGFLIDKAARQRQPWLNSACDNLNADWAQAGKNP